MKKISAAFDGLKFSTSTMEYAISIAINSKALLSGVFLDSFLYHSFKIYDMIGSKGISSVKMKHTLTKDKEMRLKSAATFKKACTKANIKYIVHHDESFAIQELLKESIYSDLVLISADETFNHFTEERPTEFIRELLEGTQSPVIIVPHEYKAIEKVILLYDGKPSSVFAIKMFNYMMPWMQSFETEVISVTDQNDSNELPDNKLIKEFVDCHYPDATFTLLYGNPEAEILSHLKRTSQNVLVVLGANRRAAVSRWFKTSMADVLIKELDLPLFIAHNK